VPSPADPSLTTAAAAGIERVADAVNAASGVPVVVLIDGRSGAGKSTFADTLAGRFPDAAVVRLDDVYPGWDGLRAATDIVHERVLTPLRRGEPARWPLWDWSRDRPSGRHATVEPAPVVIVEGAGVLTAASAVLADVTVWLEAPDAARKARALARDGDAYRPHWERWAAQEDAHLRENRPAELARIVVVLP
jgi:uridine kinase